MEVTEWLRWMIRRVNSALLEEMKLPEFTATAPPPGGTSHMTSREFTKAMAAAQWSQCRLEETLERHALVVLGNMVVMLRRFYPDISQEQLSDHVHCAVHSNYVLGKADDSLRRKLHAFVPADRRQWHADDVETHLAAVRRASWSAALIARAAMLPRDPLAQVVALSAGGGAVVGGTAGVSGGLFIGASAGALLGVPAAFLTFCFSIPMFAAVGGALGACAGAITGASAGATAGAALGGIGYVYRTEFKRQGVQFKEAATKTVNAAEYARLMVLNCLRLIHGKTFGWSRKAKAAKDMDTGQSRFVNAAKQTASAAFGADV